MQRLYYADLHLFDTNILRHCHETRHQFSSVADMNEYIVETHNLYAEKDTDVYILGDVAVRADERELRKLFDKMKGSKHLIIGNHDGPEVLNQRWSTRRPWHMVKDNGKWIYLQHVPAVSWPGLYRGHFHFHGHTHAKLPSYGRAIDVGLDAWDMRPVTAEEAIARMQRRNHDYDSYVPENSRPILSDEDNMKEQPYTPLIYDGSSYKVDPRNDYADEIDVQPEQPVIRFG